MMFLGDQGRDALIVSQIFKTGDLVFIGPVTSVGNMYLGPLYYYFMAPFLWLTYPNPVGPAYAVALLSILAVPLTYFLGRRLVGQRAAMIGALLMTFSSVIVYYSRFSWNPNPSPIVALVMVFATYQAWQKNKWYWPVVVICFSILIQLHYLTLLMAGGAGLIWLWQLRETLVIPSSTKKWREVRHLLLVTAVSVIILAVSLIPLVLFDLKHDWLNVKAFQALFTQEEILAGKSGASPIQQIAEVVKGTHGRSVNIFFESTFGKTFWLNSAMLLALIVIMVKLMVAKTKDRHQPGFVVLLAYLTTIVIGMAAYEHSIFDHYVIFALPVVFLTLGVALGWLSRHLLGRMLVIGWLGAFVVINLPEMPLTQNTPSIYDIQAIAESIQTKLKPNEQYSLVLLAPSGDLYGQNYRYFLSTGPTPALPPERAGEADSLVVINEEHLTGVPSLPIYEIVTFPEKTPSEVYTIPNGPQIWIFRKPINP